MDVQTGPRTEMTEDRSDQGPKWMHTERPIQVKRPMSDVPNLGKKIPRSDADV